MRYINRKNTDYIENKGDILACKYYHGFGYPNGTEAIGDCGSKEIDNRNWDVFHVHYETKDSYYGVPMLGMGLMDCMILKTDTRPFLEDEFNYRVGMYGSHTGKLSSSGKCDIVIEPIVNKF